MSNAPEEFEQLRKLLKVKRYEQPPPGFFNNFSTKVVNRIEAHNEGVGQAWAEAPWLRKFMMLLETNPLAAGLFGLSVCGLLVSGIAYSEYSPASDFSSASDLSLDVAGAGAGTPASWARTAGLDATAPSMNPMYSTNVGGLQFGLDQLSVQKVNFTVGQ
jgi:hypothetical protein